VIVVTLEDPRRSDRDDPPVHLDVVLAHEAGLKTENILMIVSRTNLKD
jgi:hypothetical protein